MKLVFRGIIPLLLFFALVPLLSKAQQWEYDIALGTSGYMGEYNQDNIFKFNSVTGSVGAKYNFNSTWGVRGGLSLIGINGNANYDVEPGLPMTFKSKSVIELSVLPQFNFFNFEPTKKNAAYTPYVFVGIGTMFFKDIGNLKLVIPIGAGFKYNLKENFTVDSHLNYRLADTDMLDDQGSGWKGSVFDKIASADSYMTFQIGLTYTFFKQGCPTW